MMIFNLQPRLLSGAPDSSHVGDSGSAGLPSASTPFDAARHEQHLDLADAARDGCWDWADE